MENENPNVSILMNCYNGEKYLRQAVESVLRQSYQNWEVIFWDNQSTDRSAEIFLSFADCRLKYFYSKEHTTQYEARNLAVMQAGGNFLAFLDVDDTWEPNKLDSQLTSFEDIKVGLVCSNYYIFYEGRNKTREYFKEVMPQGFVLGPLLSNYYVGLPTLLIRREILQKYPTVFDPFFQIIGDFDLVIRLAAEWKLAVIQYPLATYRVHGENESIKKRKLKAAELEAWCEQYLSHPLIGLNKNFRYVKSQALFSHAINELLDGKRWRAWGYIIKMNLSAQKIKALIAFLLPTFFLRKYKLI